MQTKLLLQSKSYRGHDGKYLIDFKYNAATPLQSLTNRATREKLFKSSWTRAEKMMIDIREVPEKMARLRLQKPT
jgi:peptidyl-dipeptidase Dcp